MKEKSVLFFSLVLLLLLMGACAIRNEQFSKRKYTNLKRIKTNQEVEPNALTPTFTDLGNTLDTSFSEQILIDQPEELIREDALIIETYVIVEPTLADSSATEREKVHNQESKSTKKASRQENKAEDKKPRYILKTILFLAALVLVNIGSFFLFFAILVSYDSIPFYLKTVLTLITLFKLYLHYVFVVFVLRYFKKVKKKEITRIVDKHPAMFLLNFVAGCIYLACAATTVFVTVFLVRIFLYK